MYKKFALKVKMSLLTQNTYLIAKLKAFCTLNGIYLQKKVGKHKHYY